MKIGVWTYGISTDDERRRNEEQFLSFSEILWSDEASLTDVDSINGHFLRRETWIREPVLKRSSVLKWIYLAAPWYLRSFLHGSCRGLTGRNWAVDSGTASGHRKRWEREGEVLITEFVKWRVSWEESRLQDTSFCHWKGERTRRREKTNGCSASR